MSPPPRTNERVALAVATLASFLTPVHGVGDERGAPRDRPGDGPHAVDLELGGHRVPAVRRRLPRALREARRHPREEARLRGRARRLHRDVARSAPSRRPIPFLVAGRVGQGLGGGMVFGTGDGAPHLDLPAGKAGPRPRGERGRGVPRPLPGPAARRPADAAPRLAQRLRGQRAPGRDRGGARRVGPGGGVAGVAGRPPRRARGGPLRGRALGPHVRPGPGALRRRVGARRGRRRGPRGLRRLGAPGGAPAPRHGALRARTASSRSRTWPRSSTTRPPSRWASSSASTSSPSAA